LVLTSAWQGWTVRSTAPLTGTLFLTGTCSLLHTVVTASLWVLLYEGGGRDPSPRLRALCGAGVLHHTRAPGLAAPIYVSHPVWPTCVTYFLLLRPLARTLGVTFLGGEFGLSLLLFYPAQSIPLRAIPMKGTGKCFLLLHSCAQIEALLVTLHLE